MATKLARDTFRALATQELQADEEIEAVFAAIGPNPDVGGAFGWASAFPLLWLSRRLARKRLHSSVTDRSGFPVARRMVIVLTNRRLLVWSVSRRWAPGKLIGDVGRDRIIETRSPTVGQGWRTLVLTVADAEPATIKVTADNVDSLTAALSRPS